jgi:hypothetical protein
VTQKKKNIDPEIPPTTRADWIGAAKVVPSQKHSPKIAKPMTFGIYRASNDRELFAVIDDAKDRSKLPDCPRRGRWEHFKTFAETGQSRVGLSETEAKADIKKTGFHLARIDIADRAAPERPLKKRVAR